MGLVIPPKGRHANDRHATSTVIAEALPRAPVFGWSSLRGPRDHGAPNIGQLPNQVLTTSGRAAIFHALKLLELPDQRGVLLPTYHCPTMVAPSLLAGLRPMFYALGEDGLPDVEALERGPASEAGAILVPHLFGRTQSLANVRRWCDANGVALIEDCAHACFGQAGDRLVGGWGDFAVASLTKFLPVPEGGLLASAVRFVPDLALRPRPWTDEAKGWVDVIECGALHGRIAGFNALLGTAFRAKHMLRRTKWRRDGDPESDGAPCQTVAQALASCDMARVSDAPLSVVGWMRSHLSFEQTATARRLNFDTYAQCLRGVRGAFVLAGTGPNGAGWPEAVAPYVFPLWVDNADDVYARVRKLRLPVFRWDRLWPGTPALPGDRSIRWSRHVLQLLCHQDLSRTDVERVSHSLRQLVIGH